MPDQQPIIDGIAALRDAAEGIGYTRVPLRGDDVWEINSGPIRLTFETRYSYGEGRGIIVRRKHGKTPTTRTVSIRKHGDIKDAIEQLRNITRRALALKP